MTTATATELRAGRKTARLEAAIEAPLSAAIDEVATEIAGGAEAKSFRSEAARVLLAEAILARRAKASRAARA